MGEWMMDCFKEKDKYELYGLLNYGFVLHFDAIGGCMGQ